MTLSGEQHCSAFGLAGPTRIESVYLADGGVRQPRLRRSRKPRRIVSQRGLRGRLMGYLIQYGVDTEPSWISCT